MQRNKLPLGYIANLRFHVVEAGIPIPGLATTFLWQCDTYTSPNYGKFYDFTNDMWSSTPVQNALSPVFAQSGIYGADISHQGLSTVAESYLVTFNSNSVIHPLVAFEIWEFGVSELQWLESIHAYLLAPRKELHRFNGDLGIEERIFDAKTGGNEIIRISSVQDPSGAQPEETRTNNTDLIP